MHWSIMESSNTTMKDSILQSVIVEACKIFAPIMYINFMLVLIYSSIWALYLGRKLCKDNRKEKMHSKLHNNQPEYIWLNNMKNFRSNRIKNRFLLAICLSEITMTLSINFAVVLQVNSKGGKSMQEQLNLWMQNPVASFPTYDYLVEFTPFRITSTVTTISVCVMASLVRILTQYMVQQYGYFKSRINLIFEVYLSLSCLFVLFFIATVLRLLMVFNICIALVLIYEYTELFIASKQLRLLLRQRLYDATQHGNRSKIAIIYHRIAYNEYKNCSIVILVAFFAQFLGVSIYGINQLVMKLVEFNPGNPQNCPNLSPHVCEIIFISESCLSVLELVLSTIGTSIQILMYSVVTIRRIVRYIRNRIQLNDHISSSKSPLQHLIEENNIAYRIKQQNIDK